MQNERLDELYKTQGLEIIDLMMGLKNFALVGIGGLFLIFILFTFISSIFGSSFAMFLSVLLTMGLIVLSYRAFQVNKKMI
jgi:hypothetical protein